MPLPAVRSYFRLSASPSPVFRKSDFPFPFEALSSWCAVLTMDLSGGDTASQSILHCSKTLPSPQYLQLLSQDVFSEPQWTLPVPLALECFRAMKPASEGGFLPPPQTLNHPCRSLKLKHLLVLLEIMPPRGQWEPVGFLTCILQKV